MNTCSRIVPLRSLDHKQERSDQDAAVEKIKGCFLLLRKKKPGVNDEGVADFVFQDERAGAAEGIFQLDDVVLKGSAVGNLRHGFDDAFLFGQERGFNDLILLAADPFGGRCIHASPEGR